MPPYATGFCLHAMEYLVFFHVGREIRGDEGGQGGMECLPNLEAERNHDDDIDYDDDDDE